VAPGPVWIGAKKLDPTGIRSPDRPAPSQSLYRLRYPVHNLIYIYIYICVCVCVCVYIYICVCVCVCIYIYIYIFLNGLWEI